MKKLLPSEILMRFVNIHKNTYDYSMVNIKNVKSKVKINCFKHGIFEQTPQKHMYGQGCPLCGHITTNIKRRKFEKLKEMAIKIHGNKYDYSEIIYKRMHDNAPIICSKHGVFMQSMHNHVKNKQNCPNCQPVSKGEMLICDFLNRNNIKFQKEKQFDLCVNPDTKRKLKFDFYLPENNLCIEFDGEQHFNVLRIKNTHKAKEKLNSIKKLDSIKNLFCKTQKINLIRIPYTQIKNVEKILLNWIKI